MPCFFFGFWQDDKPREPAAAAAPPRAVVAPSSRFEHCLQDFFTGLDSDSKECVNDLIIGSATILSKLEALTRRLSKLLEEMDTSTKSLNDSTVHYFSELVRLIKVQVEEKALEKEFRHTLNLCLHFEPKTEILTLRLQEKSEKSLITRWAESFLDDPGWTSEARADTKPT